MSDQSPPPLRVANLSKSYRLPGGGAFEAVHDVSFEVTAKQCFGLLGPNGAGKSTTIQCICGFYPPTTGNVFISGIDVHTKPKQARQGLGVCNQEDTLDSDFNVTNQLIRHAAYFYIDRHTARDRAQKLLERFGLTDKATQMIESLSGGLRRRLQVARALISEPKVLVLDEPTTGLDPDARRELWEVLTEAREKGTAILLSTHYMDEAERLCDRIAIIYKGRILDIDSPERLIKKHIARDEVEEEVRPGVLWKRKPNLEDVYLKLTGSRLGVEGL
ncbi:MAG: ATP-binding cassette domain-containing protein [Alphaproteobacteria bacterium]|nr:ATP-binding cassette domain-containing protein [Alphaproteobacteria bacterium]